MADYLALLFQSEGFMPHGQAYLWTPGLLLTYIVSDGVIALAYFSILVALIYFLKKHSGIPFHRVFVLLSIFIFACAAAHLLSIWTIWHPQYWLEATIKALTAGLSMATAVLLWRLLPQAQKPTTARQLQTVIEQLEREIAERSILAEQLHQRDEEIARQKIELERAGRGKFAFLANMSHELRTPLNAIIGFTGTLLMRLPGPLNSDQERQLTTIQSSSRQLLSLINDLLDLSRIESGAVALQIEAVVCQDLLREVAEPLRLQAQQKGLQFHLEMPDCALIASTDRRAVSQILLNLLKNALKFTDNGKVVARLELAGPAEDRHIEIKVADTGIGIEPEHHERLFQPFTQLDASPARRFEGTGLGLYLSRKLAGLLDAKISVRSRPGLGSEFILTLKLQGETA